MGTFLETGRLTLRRFTVEDTDNLIELDSDPEVMRFLSGGVPTPPEQVRDEILPRLLGYYETFEGFGCWAVQEKGSGEFLGWYSLRPDPQSEGVELGYRLRRSAWGRGYATEAGKALLHKGFTELGVERVWAQTMTVNVRSRRVMEKLGLRYVRTFWPDLEPIPGSEEGDVEYAVTKASIVD
ncbi:GNAT family N-acetyltransferase [Amycolatopsis sp.]|uniref:GNAT family N-acetyltransferase n=1 Tax=Amycolatopsis sp. TaxID=37632 RepID=UPI002CFCFDDE|nr:GNAT family N-acetyltransferase [Amycolatopsis sp.]HVV08928.1 GNAT family N-acetyltransferase [Amycolatopsis sp.]